MRKKKGAGPGLREPAPSKTQDDSKRNILELLRKDLRCGGLKVEYDADTALRAFHSLPIEYVLRETVLYWEKFWKQLGQVNQLTRYGNRRAPCG